MRRKDIIIISVLLNAGILAILFVTANLNEEKILEQTEVSSALSNAFNTKLENDPEIIPITSMANTAPIEDELDNVLKEYTISNQNEIDEEGTDIPSEIIVPQKVEKPKVEENALQEVNYVEITVKKGDALEKIARANGTTVSAIKKANNLTNERLKIGQVLKIPINDKKPAKIENNKKVSSNQKPPQVLNNEPQYYTIKSGDNPWKIAKQFSVDFDVLLKLNELDELSAKNLKVGDKIRVR